MYKKMMAITKQRHRDKKIMQVNHFGFAGGTYIVSLIANEFNKAASIYPIVFVKDGSDKLRPFALFGLEKGENLFVDKDGRWLSHYVPAVIRRYPFVLGRSENGTDLILCIDDESGFLSDTQGEPLYDEKGQPGPVMEKARDYLIELQRHSELTNLFSDELARHDLLAPLKMQIRNAEGEMVNVDGIFAVNEKKLSELSDEDFVELRRRGALQLIYAHLVSLVQMERLVQMKSEKK